MNRGLVGNHLSNGFLGWLTDESLVGSCGNLLSTSFLSEGVDGWIMR